MNAQPPPASIVGPATLHLIAPPAYTFRHRVMSRRCHTNLNVSSRGFAARNPPVFSRPHFGHSLTGRPWRPGATSAIEKLTQPFADRIFLIPNGSLPDQLFEFGRSRRSCCPVLG